MKKAKTTKDRRNSKAKEKLVKKGSGTITPPPQATLPPMAKIPKKPPTDEEV